MAVAQRAVDLARTLRGAGRPPDPPAARQALAGPARSASSPIGDALLALVADEVNVKAVELIGDESALVERRVKPLLPRIGKRLGPAIPAVMAAARDGRRSRSRPTARSTLAGVTLAPDEVEIQATPRPGTAVAEDDGLVVVLDTRADARAASPRATPASSSGRSRTCAREAGLELDDRIDLWVGPVPPAVAGHLHGRRRGDAGGARGTATPPADVRSARRSSSTAGRSSIALRRRAGRRVG